MGYTKTFTPDDLNNHYYTKYPELLPLKEKIDAAVEAIVNCYKNGGTVFCCGNGGSSADSAHIVGELLKGFLARRPLSDSEKEAFSRHGELGKLMAEKMQGSLAAVDLTTQQSILSAVANDNDPVTMYAQQLWGLGKKGDILIGLSTSGNAKNVLCAGIAAAEKGMTTFAMTGEGGGLMGQHFDLLINAPSSWTPEVQEYHIAIYHLICALVEAALFSQ
jgi:D-sedoheptulose 7-phosphate isomerase